MLGTRGGERSETGSCAKALPWRERLSAAPFSVSPSCGALGKSFDLLGTFHDHPATEELTEMIAMLPSRASIV
jgi:hypothetical protein